MNLPYFLLSLVGILASYTALDIMSKMMKKQRNNYLWLTLSAASMGLEWGRCIILLCLLITCLLAFILMLYFLSLALIIAISGSLGAFLDILEMAHSRYGQGLFWEAVFWVHIISPWQQSKQKHAFIMPCYLFAFPSSSPWSLHFMRCTCFFVRKA